MAEGRTFVFAGPTIDPDEVRSVLPEATCLPPVAQGDVFRAARFRPRAIGIVDGLFDLVPSVWHKEILFALDQGIAVFGAASMGALRAAELDRFGMIGVGGVYEAFRDGALEDDDEVAIAHGPADAGFRELSEAMVNIRATLQAAEQAAIITAATRQRIESAAKALFYPERTYAAALEGAASRGADAAELQAFREWLPGGKINAKRNDALRMLRRMAEHAPCERPPFRFEPTVFFAQLATEAPWDDSSAPDVRRSDTGVLDELRLDPTLWQQTVTAATLRAIAERDADARGLVVSNEALVDATLRFRRGRNLHDSGDLLAWMERNDLDGQGFVELMEHESRLEWLLRSRYDEALAHVPHTLRANSLLASLRARAHAKAQWIETQGLAAVPLAHLGVSEAELFVWYFGRLDRDVPADLPAYAQSAGFDDAEGLRRAVVREFLFATRGPHRDPAGS